ncbi:metalloenzyme [Blastocladiella britannica]|nr:metalloenzyme [Blastocladiella britannica]
MSSDPLAPNATAPAMPAEATLNAAPTPFADATPTVPIATPVCLIAIDGWGINPSADSQGDAVRDADTPVMDALRERHAYTTLAAHGLAVGLPDGLMGNSEVGHLNIGAGRVVYQDIVRIDLSVERETIGGLPNVKAALDRAKNGSGRIHFVGLISDGGVHSHQNHLYALLKAAKRAGIPHAYIHFIGDGRDTSPKSAAGYLAQLLSFVNDSNDGYGELATIVGRYYAMDRDKRWERVQQALEGYLQAKGETVEGGAAGAVAAIEARYAAGLTDEFLTPLIVNPAGTFQKGDTVFTFNYRSDRMRQFVASLSKGCGGFSPLATALPIPENLHITTMTQYKADFPFPVAFPAQTMDNCLAEVLAAHHVRQCHIAETEKYAHVTFFFNGGCEKQFVGEDRVLIPSPRVATYDLQPGMSAHAVGDATANVVASKQYPFVMCNFAPPDMVGHTGKLAPAVQAVAATDAAIGVIARACAANGYALIITADHGNAEKMIDETTGNPHTAHTTARVPLCVMTPANHAPIRIKTVEGGKAALCDVAPTVLRTLGLPVPAEMDGQSLLIE